MGKRKTTKDVEDFLCGLGYFLIKEYKKNNQRRVIIDDKWGYRYDTKLIYLNVGKRPLFAQKGNPNTLKNISTWIKKEKKNFEICDDNVYTVAAEKLWFHCLNSDCGMYFDISWHAVYSHNQGCPYCSFQRVSDMNRLSIISPIVSKDWDWNLNKDSPDDFSFSSDKKKWWICPNGHESYLASINNRTNKGSGCPTCANKQKESKVATELKIWAKETFGEKNVDIEHLMFINPESGRWLKCDIYLGNKKSKDGIYIEINGKQHYLFIDSWHKTFSQFEYNKKLDKIKKKFAKKNGYFIEIDLRKFENSKKAVSYIEKILKKIKLKKEGIL